MAPVTTTTSQMVFCFHAASIPSGTARRVAMTTAGTTSDAVTPNPPTSISSTGRCWAMELPRSPAARRLSHTRNCTATGLSRPMSRRSSASARGFSRSPSISCAGSPGMARISTNTITATISNVGTASAIRCRAYLSKRASGNG